VSLYLEQKGDGTPLVLIHGWGLHGGLWGNLPDMLAEHFRVVLVDLPGHGYSDKLPELTVETMVQSVIGELNQVLDGAVILGWSMGAFVAFELARRFPDTFNRLVWVAGTPSFIKRPGWSTGMEPQTLEQFAHGLEKDYRATLKRFISLNGGMGTDRTLLKTMQQQAFDRGQVDAASLDQGLRVLRDSDIRSDLAQSTMPMLLVQGSQDRLVHPGTVDAISGLRPVVARIIDGAGHAPFLSDPAPVMQAIQDFCR